MSIRGQAIQNPKSKIQNQTMFLGFAVVGLAVALVVALVAAWLSLNPPAKDLQDLTLFLLVSGSVSVGLGAIGFRLGLGTRVPSLAVSVALVYLVGVAVVGINIIYTSSQMFFSKEHDLPLLTVLLIFSAVISLFFAIFMAHSMVSRLHALLAVARQVADGDLTARVDVNSRDEIGRLSSEFNDMVKRLGEMQEERARLESSRRELIAAVSHDLRTPLASMRAMIEALNDGVVTDSDTVHRYLHTIQGETQHLATLIDDLFELSQIDAGALKLHLEPTSLADLVSDALESMNAQAEKKKVRLEGHVEGAPPRVPLDAPRMQRVLYNLIQNAIRHTPQDGTITLRVRGAEDQVELMIMDTGEGIPEGDLPHIFDRFYRGERARTRERQDGGPGAGLGLAIARGIVEAHGGSIHASSMPGQGAAFHVVLPAMAGVGSTLTI
ncbi:MAG: ATP-binding protein [Chloroflexia bacterium]